MQSQALRSPVRHAIAVFALAGLAAACGGSPVSPFVTAGSGLNGLAADATSVTPSASAGHATPFKGTLEGAYTLAFPSPLTLLVEGTGTGNATQLGLFTFDYDETVNLSTGVGTGNYEFTGANGDKLTAHWTGAGFPTDDPTVLRIVENATINGGTGRFANASGSFTVERFFSFVTNSGGGSIEGTIRLR